MYEIEWITTRLDNCVHIKKKVSTMSGSIVSLLKYENTSRILLGFSKDRKTLYIKKSDSGIRLSVNTEKSVGRTFSSGALMNQFGKEVMGTYELKGCENEIAILSKVDDGVNE
jgi:hypothetical protein